MPQPSFAWTSRVDGDLSGDLSGRALRYPPAAPAPLTWLNQVHGSDVVVVSAPGEHAGADADAAVTEVAGCALTVRTADCAPLVLIGPRTVGVVHVGWKGLVAGVVGRAVEALRCLDASRLEAHLGPCIRPGCYEFDGPERDVIARRFGGGVRATTTWGTPALDIPAAVRVALHEMGIERLHDRSGCTACDDRWYSHRARGEQERFATVAWIPGP